MTYTGLLRAAHSQDAMAVSLKIEGEILRATEPGGSTWDIALERVRLLRWSERELQLELAGEAVSFVPEDPGVALRELVPALRSGEHAGVVTAVDRPPRPGGAEERPPAATGLVVDLTDTETEPPPVPVAPRPRPGPAPVRVAPSPRRAPRPRRRRAVIWAGVALAIVAGALIVASLRSDPEEQARQALDRAGFATVAVVVDEGTATLSGAVRSQEQSDAAEAAVAAVGGVADIRNELEVAEALPRPTTPATTVIERSAAEDAASALAGLGFDSATVQTDGSLAVVSGIVASEAERRTAVAALLDVDGVDTVSNQLTVLPVADDSVAASVRTALDESGFEAVKVTVEDGVVTLTGVVPLEALDAGFFRYSDRAEAIVVEQDGVTAIRNRLQLTGDAVTLRAQLRSLTESAPIIFGLGESTLTEASRATLDTATEVIQAQPGLRVLIAGHTDTTGSAGVNEQLSQERADAVRQYLIDQGIAANRLVVVAYGELFPSTPGIAPLDRRVEFEVAG
jgi:outer membrane protein OmpA-like peptidoglycan-associated protein